MDGLLKQLNNPQFECNTYATVRNKKTTLLEAAIAADQIDMLKFLIEKHNFDPNMESCIKLLDTAVFGKYYDIVEYLLPYVKDINETYIDEDSGVLVNILQTARDIGDPDIIELLEMLGANTQLI